MGKKPGDSKISGIKPSAVKPADTAKEVAGTEAVSEVGQISGVRATEAVKGAKGAGSAGRHRATRTITLEEREHLFKVVQEEAEKIFGSSVAGRSRKKTVTDAVKMAIDAGLIGEEAEKKSEKKPGK